MQNNTFEDLVKRRQTEVFGRRYEDASLSRIRLPESEQKKIVTFLEKKEDMLIFCGNPGIGKTFLCACFTAWAMQNFTSWRYYHEAVFLQRVRDCIDLGGDCGKEVHFLLDDPFIMLDDIGSGKLNEWREEILFQAIDFRYSSRLPTMLTSNFTRKEFEENYHRRIASRIFSKDNVVIEIPNGPDFRTD